MHNQTQSTRPPELSYLAIRFMLLQRPCVNAEKFDGCHPDHPREFCRSSAKFCSRAVNARERTHSCLRSNTEFLASRCLTIQVAGTKKWAHFYLRRQVGRWRTLLHDHGQWDWFGRSKFRLISGTR